MTNPFWLLAARLSKPLVIPKWMPRRLAVFVIYVCRNKYPHHSTKWRWAIRAAWNLWRKGGWRRWEN